MRRFSSLAKLNREAAERQAQTRRAKEETYRAKINWWKPINWNWTALATCVIAGFTVLLYCVGINQWHTFQGQLAIMQGQMDVMKADQRPWIKIEQIAPKDSPMFGGLMFHGPKFGGILPLHFLLKNVGHSPAFDVRVGIGQVFGYAHAQKIDDLAKEEQVSCASLDNAFPQVPMVI